MFLGMDFSLDIFCTWNCKTNHLMLVIFCSLLHVWNKQLWLLFFSFDFFKKGVRYIIFDIWCNGFIVCNCQNTQGEVWQKLFWHKFPHGTPVAHHPPIGLWTHKKIVCSTSPSILHSIYLSLVILWFLFPYLQWRFFTLTFNAILPLNAQKTSRIM